MAEDLEEDIEDNEDGSLDEASDSGGKKSRLKLIIIIAVAVVLLIVIGGVAMMFLGGDEPEKPANDTEMTDQEADSATATVPGPTVFMDLPELLINLQNDGKKQSFLKIRITLELDSVDDVAKLDRIMPRIIDIFQVYLRELRPEDLRGSAGMHLLREELLTRMQIVSKPVNIRDVLFREMLVQ